MLYCLGSKCKWLLTLTAKTTTIQRKPSGPAHKPKTYVEQLQQLNPGSRRGQFTVSLEFICPLFNCYDNNCINIISLNFSLKIHWTCRCLHIQSEKVGRSIIFYKKLVLKIWYFTKILSIKMLCLLVKWIFLLKNCLIFFFRIDD